MASSDWPRHVTVVFLLDQSSVEQRTKFNFQSSVIVLAGRETIIMKVNFAFKQKKMEIVENRRKGIRLSTYI